MYLEHHYVSSMVLGTEDTSVNKAGRNGKLGGAVSDEVGCVSMVLQC